MHDCYGADLERVLVVLRDGHLRSVDQFGEVAMKTIEIRFPAVVHSLFSEPVAPEYDRADSCWPAVWRHSSRYIPGPGREHGPLW